MPLSRSVSQTLKVNNASFRGSDLVRTKGHFIVLLLSKDLFVNKEYMDLYLTKIQQNSPTF